MLLKWIGCILIVATTTGAGIFLSDRFSQRVNELRLSIDLVDRMKSHLQYRNTPTKQMIRELAEYPVFEKLQFLPKCRKRLESGERFPEAWRAAITETSARQHFTKEDKTVLLSLGDIIGSAQTGSQISSIELTKALLESNCREAVEEKQKQGKLYRNLGVLSGIAVSILIL